MKKVIDIYKEIMTGVGVICLIGFILCVLIQVISRTFLPTAPNWTEEGARFLFIFMVAFAGNTAVLNDEYVGVDMLVEVFPKGLQKMIHLIIYVGLLAFSAFIFFVSVLGADGLLAITPVSMVSTALELPMKKVYISMVILFGFYIVSFALRIYLLLTKKEG